MERCYFIVIQFHKRIMRILLVHNHYISTSPSGEDIAFDNERQLLQQAGHEVIIYVRHNNDISNSPIDRFSAATELFWSRRTYREITSLIKQHQPEVAHFHNTFPLVSASGYQACKDNDVPVVQTLHNYRLICPGALLLRDGKPCEKCIGNRMLPAIKHGCYRDSRAATALTTAMLNTNRSRGVYSHLIDRYICLTPNARERMIRGGLPAEKIVVKANVLRNPPERGGGNGGYALYVGRLTKEKGVQTLVDAWTNMDYPLLIAGDGALRSSLQQRSERSLSNIQFLGFQQREEVMRLMQDATMLIIPSECYEGFPVTVLEAYATGTPLVVSAIGALDELVNDPVNGKKFPAGDAAALRQAVIELLHDSQSLQSMRSANRIEYESKYAQAQAVQALEKIYCGVISNNSTLSATHIAMA